MKKVLIISEHFYPSNNIGARRPTMIAKKLYKKGYYVDVLTRFNVQNTENLCNNVFSFETKKDLDQNAIVQKKVHGKLFLFVYRLLRPVKTVIGINDMFKKFKYVIQNNETLKTTAYDAVISSFGPMSSLLSGIYYNKYHSNTKWICDFRDPVIVKFIDKSLRPLFRYYESIACKHADAIVAVSNGYLKRICKGKYQEKAFMIPNCYDRDDMLFSNNIDLSPDYMTITYVGALYNGSRDLTPLFRALCELIDSGDIDKNRIKIAYAGNEFDCMVSQASKYGLQYLVKNKGNLSRESCLKLQFSSHILLLSTWNDKKEYGVFPGKLLEYMLINKPIISITDGNIPKGEVTEVIREGELGIAYESVCDKSDFTPLKDYIKNCYKQWLIKGNIDFFPRKDVLERYDSETVIKQLEDLING